MRIISGFLGGRRFYPPANKWPTRPTTDIAKEGLFNILNNMMDFSSITVLDLFGGTGSHSLECISRGCTDVTYVDKFGGCIKFVSDLSHELDVHDHMKIVRVDVGKFIKLSDRAYNYIFAGPPYPLKWIEDIPRLIFDCELLLPDGLFVLEHNDRHLFASLPEFDNQRNYGDTVFSFFKNDTPIRKD